MLKTNSKKARENIRAFILENTNEEANAETFREASAYILQHFRDQVYSTANDRRYFGFNESRAFDYWASGLPSNFHSCTYYLAPAVDILGDILEQTPAERAKYTETQAESLLTYLIYRELIKEEKNQ